MDARIGTVTGDKTSGLVSSRLLRCDCEGCYAGLVTNEEAQLEELAKLRRQFDSLRNRKDWDAMAKF